MQSQLKWGQKKFIKFEMKREGVKKKSNNWSMFFQIALKGGEGVEILLGGILTIQCFCHAAGKIQ